MDISFVIPAFNEEEFLPLCLNSIAKYCSDYEFEIILIDNGSTDSTAQLATDLGAKVIVKPEGTISSLRNTGAKHSSGNILIFLDADIELTQQWHSEFVKIYPTVKEQPILTGSQAATPTPPTFLEKFWFEEFYKKQEITHLGSAHLILSRKCFDMIGGFNEALETGEDYDFCQRAKKANINLMNNISLRVVHHGFPKRISDFIKRESWHGKSDFTSLQSLLNSKVAIASVIFFVSHLILLFALLTSNWFVGSLAFLAILGLLSMSIITKYSHSNFTAKAVNLLIFYFYYVGRTWSGLKVLKEKLN